MKLKPLNLTELTSDDVHPQVRANFQYLKDWSLQVMAALKTSTAPKGAGTVTPSGGSSTTTKVTFQRNGSTVGVQSGVNLVDGGGVTWKLVNNPIQGRVDVSAVVATSGGGSLIPRLVTTQNGFTAPDNTQVTLSARIRVAAGGSIRTFGSGTMKAVN